MKHKINNRKIDKHGLVTQDDQSLFQSLFINPKAIESANSYDSEEVVEYNKWAKIFDLPAINYFVKDFDDKTHEQNQQQWQMPQSYKDMDIEKYLLEKCETDLQKQRILSELDEFNARDMQMLLKYLVYLVDTLRKNNIVWGIGRGSSVSSYVLYKIGIHRVDSLKYSLDIKEFLKD